jgi:hypothetical protein
VDQTGPAPQAKDLAAEILQIQTNLKYNLSVSQQMQAEFHNKKRIAIKFNVGDYVWLSTANFKRVRPKKKLDYKFDGPFRVLALVGPSSYKLDLGGSKLIHPVFHVSLLEPFEGDDPLSSREGLHDNFLSYEGDDVYIVDKIVDRRRNEYGLWEYKILWKGYPESEATWEVATQISDPVLRKYNRINGWTDKAPTGEGLNLLGSTRRSKPNNISALPTSIPKERQGLRSATKRKADILIPTTTLEAPSRRGRGRPPKKRRPN